VYLYSKFKKGMEKNPGNVVKYVDNALFVLLQVYVLMCLCESGETL